MFPFPNALFFFMRVRYSRNSLDAQFSQAGLSPVLGYSLLCGLLSFFFFPLQGICPRPEAGRDLVTLFFLLYRPPTNLRPLFLSSEFFTAFRPLGDVWRIVSNLRRFDLSLLSVQKHSFWEGAEVVFGFFCFRRDPPLSLPNILFSDFPAPAPRL